ncbi:MAG: GNAT family N-acetyltransferase [Gemmatimonadota bacterium]
MRVVRHADADAFLARASEWLLNAEAENNLILGLAGRIGREPHLFQPPIYLATIEDLGAVHGCVMRTPPFKLIVSRIPVAALPALVADVRETFATLPAVLGPDPGAHAFAQRWGFTCGVSVELGMRQRIYQLEHVREPERRAHGSLRVAQAADLDLVVTWIEAFSQEAGLVSARARALAEERIRNGELFLWIDDGPRCMAAWSGATPNSVRIGYVYTPPAHRGRGYASICTARISQLALDAGNRYCFLFTDLSNPTSNAIYQRIGYEPVCDVNDYMFTPGAGFVS